MERVNDVQNNIKVYKHPEFDINIYPEYIARNPQWQKKI